MNKITTDKAYFAWFKASLLKRKEFFYTQPALLLSLVYLALSLSGLVYLYVLGSGVGIEIVKYLEVSDFFMAFLATPAILHATIVAISSFLVGTLLYKKFEIGQSKSSKPSIGWRSWFVTWRPFYRINPVLLGALFMLILPLIYSVQVGYIDANTIIQEKGKVYQIDLVNPVDINGQSKLQFDDLKLITETERFCFFYSISLKQTLIITRDNIASIHLASQGYDNS
ncbi:hypothetical protein CWB73_10305 [Pseudoalteromonas phenolica]|uniref:Uncharacterized protein n=1 Tax=Pseudoalteromonas phenolica TaxID=161398 RepID=A0A5S3YUF1_9GAMM|nr:hypothetical protein [Pseudoalteromonas phenolica]TMP80427.1 hypothetical protein CWB73_10305 [Pseudoalteromonas phenolica]